MNPLLTLLVVCVVALGAAEGARVQKWAHFKAAHGKQFASKQAEARSRAEFNKRSALIEAHNEKFARGDVSFRMGHNQFSDVSLAQLAAMAPVQDLAKLIAATAANATAHVASPQAPPASIDLRVWGAVTPVKHQRECGSCYSFATIGALESAYWFKERRLVDLSEQHVLDCTRSYGNGGCKGGFAVRGFELAKETGITTSQNYPYQAALGTCKTNVPIAVRATGHVVLKKDVNAMMDALATRSALSTSMSADHPAFYNYESGIIDMDANKCSTSPQHAVTIVGYGTENGKEFWLIKNSYGTQWGDKGYFRIARGKNLCGVESIASYPLV